MILPNISNSNNKLLNIIIKHAKLIKSLKNSKKSFFKTENNLFIKQNTISYIINITLTSTNTLVTVNDIKGNTLVSVSAGMINLTKFQKRSQPTALLNIFKIILLKSRFLKKSVVALHFNNVKRFHELFFLSVLKEFFLIKSVQSNNLFPHNGCRPKKIKKIKRRTKRLTIK